MNWLMIVCILYLSNYCTIKGGVSALMVYPQQCKAAIDTAYNDGLYVICYDADGNKFSSKKQ